MTDESTARVFWENGFFGKGSLSRSEPNWMEKEKRRRGFAKGDTAEEVTRKRRAERKEFKLERARKEREVIEEKLKEEGRGMVEEQGNREIKANGHGNFGKVVEILAEDSSGDPKETVSDGTNGTTLDSKHETYDGTADGVDIQTVKEMSAESVTESHITLQSEKPPLTLSDERVSISFENQEHLQLTLEEAFFLAWGLGVLKIVDPQTNQLLPLSSLLPLFRSYSYFPPLSMMSSHSLLPDDPFLLSYIPYHHYRSLGWVVRPGIKFGVDFLLYLRGPVFSHAEFAVKVLPSYGRETRHRMADDDEGMGAREGDEDEKGNVDEKDKEQNYWFATEERAERTRKKENKTWDWLHCAQRVQSQVRKSLVICYVEVPPPLIDKDGDEIEEKDVKKLIQRYKVRDFIVKRWIPNRNLK